MKFCIACSHELKNGQNFCTECGTKQPGEQAEAADKNIQQRAEKFQTPQKPMSKKTKWAIGSVAALILILFGAHQLLLNHFNPVKALQEMDTAILDNDMETFLSHIDFNEEAHLDKAAYFQYIKENEWHSIKDQYMQLIESENDVFLHQTFHSFNGEPLFTVKEDSFLFDLYPRYQLQAVPSKLFVSSSIPNTEVTINEMTSLIEGTEQVEFMELYPGDYQMNASAENVFGAFTFEETLSVHPAGEMEINIPFEGNTYSFNTNQEEGYLFINGESSGKTFSELEHLGPVPMEAEESIEMHGEWENEAGEIIKTETLTLSNNGWYGINFHFEEQIPEDTASLEEEDNTEEETGATAASNSDSDNAGDVVLDFRDAYEISLNDRNFDLIDTYLKNGSSAHDDLRVYIGDLQDTDYHYDFQSNDVLEVHEIDNKIIEVTTNEIFTFTNHLNDTIDYDRTKVYTLELTDDTYEITDISYEETNRNYD